VDDDVYFRTAVGVEKYRMVVGDEDDKGGGVVVGVGDNRIDNVVEATLDGVAVVRDDIVDSGHGHGHVPAVMGRELHHRSGRHHRAEEEEGDDTENIRTVPLGAHHCRVLLEHPLLVAALNLSVAKEGGGKDRQHPLVGVAAVVDRVAAT
jgi:hypothetical protein